jgi:flagellar hook protein FlgE
MASSFFTGVTGLHSHQRWLDVLAENLGNLNTTGYKAQRLLFSDILNHTIRAAGVPVGMMSATNPAELGMGVRVSALDNVMQQGPMRSTGNSFDVAIEGKGFFVVEGGTQTLFTRAGAFTVDLTGYLVDSTTGGRIQRFGTVGEGTEVNTAFQVAGDTDIRIDYGYSIPGVVTSEITLDGNLDALATGPRREQLSTANPLATGGAPAITSTLLNALDSNQLPYITGDTIRISGTEVDGTDVSTVFPVGASSTVGDLLTATSNAFTSATASLDNAANLILLADEPGPASLALELVDSGSNTGSMDFDQHSMETSVVAGQVQEGKDGDTVTTSIEVYDETGSGHVLQLTFTKQADQEWSLRTWIDPNVATMSDDLVEGITFDANGMLQGITGTGNGDSDVEIQFAGAGAAQTISLDFGVPGSAAAMTHLGGFTTATAASQDGFATGTLSEVETDADGTIQGIFTNSQVFPIARIALANFSNPEVLARIGPNLFGVSVNSGEAVVNAPLTGQSGSIQSGMLENSNVDQPLQMTQLITAQRGFQANARSMTVQTELLQEAINLVG